MNFVIGSYGWMIVMVMVKVMEVEGICVFCFQVVFIEMLLCFIVGVYIDVEVVFGLVC